MEIVIKIIVSILIISSCVYYIKQKLVQKRIEEELRLKELEIEKERQRIEAEREAQEVIKIKEEQERLQAERENHQAIKQAEKEKQRKKREELKAKHEKQEAIKIKEEQERLQLEQERLQLEQERQLIEQEKQIVAEQEKKRKEQQQVLYEKRKMYTYFMSEPQCKLAIGNFVNRNSKTIENIILDGRMDELFKEISETKKHIDMITEEIDKIDVNAVRMEEKRNKEASEMIAILEKRASVAEKKRIRAISNEIIRVEKNIEELSEQVIKLTKAFKAATKEVDRVNTIANENKTKVSILYSMFAIDPRQNMQNAEGQMKTAKEHLKKQKEHLKSKKQQLIQVQKESEKTQKEERLQVQKNLQSAQKESFHVHNSEKIKMQNEINMRKRELNEKEEEYDRLKTGFDTFDESVSVLVNILIEDTTFELSVAKQTMHKVIIESLLNEWITDFKELNNAFCDEIDTTDIDNGIKLFAINFNKSNTLQKDMYSFFLFLNSIEIGYDTHISSLRRDYYAFENKLYNVYDTLKEAAAYENFKAALFTHIDTNKEGKNITIDDIDRMDGMQFEHFVAKLFEKMGYETEVTKHSGDQGIDVIAKNDIVAIGIQAKCYSSTVGNSSVQEALGGKAIYKVDKVMVITNNEFTPAAKQLAKATNVELWDRSKLEEKIIQYAVKYKEKLDNRECYNE